MVCGVQGKVVHGNNLKSVKGSVSCFHIPRFHTRERNVEFNSEGHSGDHRVSN